MPQQMSTRAFSLTATALALAGALSAQQPARDAAAKPLTGTSVITGTVVTDERTPRPVRHASVTLSGAGVSLQRMVVTDDAGRFAFTRLPAATYSSVRVSKPGYVNTSYGEKRYGGIGTPVSLAESQRLTLTLKMQRGAVVTGTLLDQSGRPSASTSVQATMVRLVNGERAQGSYVPYSTTTTDDRGMYRIYGLPPGEYVVGASPRLIASNDVRPITDEELRWGQLQLQPSAAGAATAAPSAPPKPAQSVAYTSVYFPGTTDIATATLVTLTAGQERTGVDFSTQLVATARIEGIIVDQNGQPPANAQINLVPKVESTIQVNDFLLLDSMLLMRSTVVNGKFTIPSVRPGAYTLAVRGAPSQGSAVAAPPAGRGAAVPMTMWASLDIAVNGEDRTDLRLQLEPGMSLTGKVVFDGTTLQPPADPSRVSIRLNAAPSPGAVTVTVGSSAGPMTADGSFKLDGVTPGRYLLFASAPAAAPVAGSTWVMRSAMANGVDITDTPLEVRPNQELPNVVVTFTDKLGEVSGTILDAAGKPTADLSIMLFPTDRTAWANRSRRIRLPVRASTSGTFKFASVLPGEYYLAALTDFEPSEVMKPEFLEQLVPAAMKITLAEGEKKVQDLKIAGG